MGFHSAGMDRYNNSTQYRPHHRRWQALCSANMISIDIDPEEEKELATENAGMLVESKASSCTYVKSLKTRRTGLDEATPELNIINVNAFLYSAHITTEPNRNTQ